MNRLRAAIARGARPTHGGGSTARGSRPGDGFAFDRLRAYAESDDPRRIDWSATARTGMLQTRVYLEETVLIFAALVDASASMRLGRKRSLEAAANEALRTWFGAAVATDRSLRVVDGRTIAARRAAVEARARTPFDLARELAFALRAVPRGASFLLVTDALDLAPGAEADELLVRLARRFDATALIAADPWIDGLPLGGAVRLRDVETGRTRRFAIGPQFRRRYRDASATRDGDLRARFERAGWRVGRLDEADGGASVERAFGLR